MRTRCRAAGRKSAPRMRPTVRAQVQICPSGRNPRQSWHGIRKWLRPPELHDTTRQHVDGTRRLSLRVDKVAGAELETRQHRPEPLKHIGADGLEELHTLQHLSLDVVCDIGRHGFEDLGEPARMDNARAIDL
eukprot:scaffold3499_cov117-Isochrysis_galbana.AAC.7